MPENKKEKIHLFVLSSIILLTFLSLNDLLKYFIEIRVKRETDRRDKIIRCMHSSLMIMLCVIAIHVMMD